MSGRASRLHKISVSAHLAAPKFSRAETAWLPGDTQEARVAAAYSDFALACKRQHVRTLVAFGYKVHFITNRYSLQETRACVRCDTSV